ncbi:MAG: lipoate--protein ligase [Oscillospiraceae bacterium]|nr:lipoate--protein ligase [Oscillospiraceae bacterium]
MTKFILNEFTSPSFNLALEEYLLNNFTEGEIIMLWRNEPSVIIGKNQNAYAEIDSEYVKQNNITVVRRVTGGGAVFHDLGNINYTLISDYKNESFGDFSRLAAPICEFLSQFGVSAALSGRNDITVNGAKISGTAQTVKNGRNLAHGTLLYDADISALSKALRPNIKKLEDKAVRSVKSRVTNVKELCKSALTAEQFMKALADYFLSRKDCKLYTLSGADIGAAKKIEQEKHSKWEWNFGFSPDFSLKTEKKYPFGIVECHLNTHDGRICDIRFFGDFFGVKSIDALEAELKDAKFEREEILTRLKNITVSDHIGGINENELADLILSAE